MMKCPVCQRPIKPTETQVAPTPQTPLRLWKCAEGHEIWLPPKTEEAGR